MPHLQIVLIQIVLIAALLVPAGAAATPFTDADFPPTSANNDPDLVVVRERYDPARNLQSLYLRLSDRTPDYDLVSGELLVRGAEIAAVIVQGEALAASDQIWGLPDATYDGVGRGLEGADPWRHRPHRGDGDDAVRLAGRHRVRFWLGCRQDVDDLRVLLAYPDEPGDADFDVRLYHAGQGGHPDPLRFPLTPQGGLKVGSQRDAVPDDGDYSEVFAIDRIKLTIEDIDLDRDALLMGEVGPEGGVLGPEPVVLDNFADAVDVDEDNGFDQNGLISPIPAQSDVDHLRWRAGDLRRIDDGEGERGQIIPAGAVVVEGLPDALPLGSRATLAVRVQISPGTPRGIYRGPLTVWEDNSGDGRRQAEETADAVAVVVVVDGPPPEHVIYDGAIPLPDAAPTPDAAPDVGWLGADIREREGSDSTTDSTTDSTIGGDEGSDEGVSPEAPAPDPRAGDADPFSEADRAGDAWAGSVPRGEGRGRLDLGDARGGGLDCRTTGGAPPSLVVVLLLFAARRRR